MKICNTDVRFSIKGYTLAVGTADGLVQLWDARTSQLIKSMKTHQGRVGKRERRVVYCKSHIQTADMYTALGCLEVFDVNTAKNLRMTSLPNIR